MSLLLNPRVLIALALAGFLAFSHFYVYRSGKQHVQAEWTASIAAANADARRLEQQRQRRADDAARIGAVRASALRADAARAGDAVNSLRDAITARNLASQSGAAAALRADTYGKLFLESSEALRAMAQSCDRHASDVKLLLDSWPVDH